MILENDYEVGKGIYGGNFFRIDRSNSKNAPWTSGDLRVHFSKFVRFSHKNMDGV